MRGLGQSVRSVVKDKSHLRDLRDLRDKRLFVFVFFLSQITQIFLLSVSILANPWSKK
jgi:hypothetical protein